MEKFEDALSRLEDIVRKLEEGGLTLDESLKCFEEGMRLSKICEGRLQEAQQKIEILVKESGFKTPASFRTDLQDDD